jgi:hypothetical protein
MVAACTLIQLLSVMVATMRRPSPLRVRVNRRRSTEPMGSPSRVKSSGTAAKTNGSAMNDPRITRQGPRRAITLRTRTAAHAMPNARNDPVGSRLSERMNPTVRRNFRRASARWMGLSRST